MGTARDSQPKVDVVNIEGLNTKTNPDLLGEAKLQVAKNPDYYTEYGSVAKARGVSRVLTNQIAGVPPVSWIGFYKSQDFAGQIVRETLYQAGTKIYMLDGTSGTELAAGQPSGLFRSHDQFNRLMFITGQDPAITGTLGDRYKFDGFQLGRWGVDAPGSEETVFEAFTSIVGFTPLGCTISDESAIAYRGGSQKMVKNAGAGSCSTTKLSKPATAVANVTEDRAEISVYIPEIEFRKLRDGDPCLRVWFSTNDDFTGTGHAGTGIWVRYDFRIGEFYKGWNTLSMDFSVYPSGLLGDYNNWDILAPLPSDDNISSIRVEFFCNPTYNADEISIYLDHCVFLDQGSPLLSVGAAGTVFPGGSGAIWEYVVTYENMYGHESNEGTTLYADYSADISDITSEVIWDYDDAADPAMVYHDVNNESTVVGGGSGGDDCIAFGHQEAIDEYARASVVGESFDMSDKIVGSYAYIDVKILNPVRAQLATDGVRVRLGDTALENYWEWQFNSNYIEEEDWTVLTIDLSDPDTIVGEIDLTSIDNVQVEFAFISGEVTATDFDLQINNFRINQADSLASWELSEIPLSSDPDVNKRHIYRSVANGITHFYVGTINDNETTTYSDTVSDSSLGVRQPPQPGQFADNTVPPNAGIVKVWKGTVFMAGDPKDPNVLYFSRDELPEAFPIINGFELDAPITGMFETNNALIVTTDNDYWKVSGDNPDYFVDRVIRNMGNAGFRSCGETRLYGWAHDTDAIRLYDLNDTNRFSEPIADKIKAMSKVNFKDIWSIYSRSLNSMLYFYPNALGEYDTCYGYQHMMDNVNDGRLWELDMPSYANYLCGEEIEDANGVERLYVGGDDGMIYELLTNYFPLWTNGDVSELDSVEMELQTIYMRAGQLGGQTKGFTGRWKPSFIEVRARDDLGAGQHVWEVTIESADGSGNNQTVRDSQTVTLTFPPGVELQRVRLLDFVPGEYCRVKVKNSDSFATWPVLQGVRLYVEAKPGQFVVSGDTPGGRS